MVQAGKRFFLPNDRGRPGGTVTHAHAGQPLQRVGKRRTVAAREDVDRVTEAGEMLRDVRYVYVLAAAVDTARRGEGRCMLADQRDFFHIESLALLVQQEVFHSPIGFQFFGASPDGSKNASDRKTERARIRKSKTARQRLRCCLRA